MWFPYRSDTNWAVQAQKQARSLKVRIYEKEEVCYRVAKTKALVTAKRICAFVFAYANCWFSHEAAQIFVKKTSHLIN